MKKLLVITLVDGTQKEFNLRDLLPDMPFDVKANDPNLLKWVATLAANGFGDKEGPEYLSWQAPSQIKRIELKFSGLQVSKN